MDRKDNIEVDHTSPATGGFTITPSDSVDLLDPTRAIYVGGTGDISVQFKDGTSATFVGVGDGAILPIVAYRILATGTTATSLVGLR